MVLMAAFLKGVGIDIVLILAQVPGRDHALLGADLAGYCESRPTGGRVIRW